MQKKKERRHPRLYKFLLFVMFFLVLSPFLFQMPFGPWPDGTKLKIWDTGSQQTQNLKLAIKGWNRAQNAVHFSMAKNREEADVIVEKFETQKQLKTYCGPFRRYVSFFAKGNITACVDWQGYKPFGKIRMGVRSKKAGGVTVATFAHELGHIVGLDHNSQTCSLMNPRTSGGTCDKYYPKPLEEKCRPEEACETRSTYADLCAPLPIDIKNFQDLYPDKTIKYKPWCFDKSSAVDIDKDAKGGNILNFFGSGQVYNPYRKSTTSTLDQYIDDLAKNTKK